MEPPFIIFGAGGQGAAVANTALELGIDVAAVVDDSPTVDSCLSVRVWKSSAFAWPAAFRFVVGIGNCSVRREIYLRLQKLGGSPITLVHPRASVSRFARIGSGTVVLAMATIDPRVTIGENIIVNLAALIGHDTIVESHSHVSANVSLGADCRVGELAWIGLGATVKEGTVIGEAAFIGMGALVSHNVPAHHKAISPHRKDALLLPIEP